MDFHRLGGTVSAKGKFRPASSMKMTSSMGLISGEPSNVGKRFISLNTCAGRTNCRVV